MKKNADGLNESSTVDESDSIFRQLDTRILAVQRDCEPYKWIAAVRSRLNGHEPLTVIFERPLKIEIDLVDREFHTRRYHWDHGLTLHPKLVEDLCAFWDEYKEDYANTELPGGAGKWWRDNWQQRNCVLTIY